MPTAHLLGTGAVTSDPHRTTTMIALDSGHEPLLIDCGGDALPRLEGAGLDPLRLGALIVTHEHADHVAGFPLLLERLWLMGRRDPLPVYAIAPTLAQVHRTHDAFDVSGFEDYPGWTAHEIPYQARAPVFERFGWRVTASPGRHAVPVVGLRFEDLATGRVCAYSGDTAPEPAITELMAGADLMVHEATGEGPAHTSATQAARIARDAGVARTVLVHLPRAEALAPELTAARTIDPNVEAGEEGAAYPF